jgi:hypothetical protein
MVTIDFGIITGIHTKLSPQEIKGLNAIFQNPSIQEKMETIEKQRKKRKKWKYGILACCALCG